MEEIARVGPNHAARMLLIKIGILASTVARRVSVCAACVSL
jgi:hypothetical protein